MLESLPLFSYIFVFFRIAGMLFSMPFFGDNEIPTQVKILLALSLTISIFPLIDSSLNINSNINSNMSIYHGFFVVIKEFVLGISIGFLSKLVFEGIYSAISLVGYQMGFGTSNLILNDPETQMTAFAMFNKILVIMFFLSLNLHHAFLHGIYESFFLIPIGQLPSIHNSTALLLSLTTDMFKISLQIAAPILVALLLTMAALGLVARAVPQVSVFTLSFPLSFFAGIIVYLSMFYFLPAWLFNNLIKQIEMIWSYLKLV